MFRQPEPDPRGQELDDEELSVQSLEDAQWNPLKHFQETGRDFTWDQIRAPVAAFLTAESARRGENKVFTVGDLCNQQIEDFYQHTWHPDLALPL